MKILGIQVRINENGRVVIPAVIRKGMSLKLGDSVVMSLEDGVLHIEPLRARVSGFRTSPRKSPNPERRLPATWYKSGARNPRPRKKSGSASPMALNAVPSPSTASRCRLHHRLLPEEPRSQH